MYVDILRKLILNDHEGSEVEETDIFIRKYWYDIFQEHLIGFKFGNIFNDLINNEKYMNMFLNLYHIKPYDIPFYMDEKTLFFHATNIPISNYLHFKNRIRVLLLFTKKDDITKEEYAQNYDRTRVNEFIPEDNSLLNIAKTLHNEQIREQLSIEDIEIMMTLLSILFNLRPWILQNTHYIDIMSSLNTCLCNINEITDKMLL
jgi:hypothetical protein